MTSRGLQLVISLLGAAAFAAPTYVRYLVLGAGPGGLQIAHYLESAGRDYLVLDRAAAPASFFAQFPRWRQLISINKRNTGRNDSLDFAMRHDWNSLLSDASHVRHGPSDPVSSTDARLDAASVAAGLRFTSWSTQYYPRADVLQEYMAAWAAAPHNASSSSPLSSPSPAAGLGRERPVRVRYGAHVVHVGRPATWRTDVAAHSRAAVARGAPRFLVALSGGDAFTCTFLVVATGLGEPVPMPGANGSAAVAAGLVHTYSTAPADARAYEGRRVLLLGNGNAAFEFAQHVLPVAAYVHIAGRPTSRLKLALETHYPGNVRLVHAAALESYNLKSLDGLTSTPFERLAFAPAAGGGVAVTAQAAACTFDAHGRSTSRCSFRHPYDLVIACLGWRFDRRAFDADALPALAANGKHPAATPRYESTNVAGMYFAGGLAHAADFKKASGGFIHGFRYTARALHRVLEEEEADAAAEEEGRLRGGGEQEAVPAATTAGGAAAADADDSPVNGEATVGADGRATVTVAPVSNGGGGRALSPPPARWPVTRARTLRSLVALLLRRINSAAGPFQLFGALADVFVLDALSDRDVAGFVAEGAHAAMHVPWEFANADAAAAAASGADPTGLADDVAAMQAPPPPGTPPLPAAARASQAAISAALAGGLREEVPIAWVAAAARRWAAAVRGGALPNCRGAPAAEWLQLTLEFGPSAPPGQKDPFALDRADVSLSHPERSHFLHPVLRYFDAAAPGCAGDGDAGAPACAPVATLHIVEDFHASWSLHTAHVLPLARFLQHVGARRAGGALAVRPRGALPLAPWLPPAAPPPPFLAGVLTQLQSGCDAAALFWAGAGFDTAGGAEGWWLQMSVEAEAALSGLRALAVHAADWTAPGVPLSPAEAAHTRSVKDKWAAVKAREAAAATGRDPAEVAVAEELPRPPPPPPAASGDGAAARAASTAAYTTLTNRTPGLAVLAVDARTGRCRALADNLRVAAGGVRIFHPGGGGAGDTKGVAVDIERAPLSPAAAVPHIAAVFASIARGGARGSMRDAAQAPTPAERAASAGWRAVRST